MLSSAHSKPDIAWGKQLKKNGRLTTTLPGLHGRVWEGIGLRFRGGVSILLGGVEARRGQDQGECTRDSDDCVDVNGGWRGWSKIL